MNDLATIQVIILITSIITLILVAFVGYVDSFVRSFRRLESGKRLPTREVIKMALRSMAEFRRHG